MIRKNKSLALKNIFQDTVFSIKENIQAFFYFWLIYGLTNYIFARIEKIDNVFFGIHLFVLYCFFFLFVRAYYNKKPLFDKNIFFLALGKFAVIILLAFFSIVVLKIGMELAFLFAKSLALFPDFYALLVSFYIKFKSSFYALSLAYGISSLILMFTMFIPAFSWVSVVLGSDSSIIFTIIETKGNYTKLFLLYFTLFFLIPIILAKILLLLHIPYLLICLISAAISVLQMVVYIQMHKQLFGSDNEEN